MRAAGRIGRHGHRNRTMILIAYRHGLRVSELVALRWEQVDLGEEFLHVNRMKCGMSSIHPLRGPELRALRRFRRDGLVAFLKQVTDQTVASIEVLRVVSVQLTHPSGEVAVDGFHQQMTVVAHLAIGMHHPIEAATDVPEHIQPILPVGIPRKDIIAPVTARGEATQRPGEFDSQRSDHGGSVAENVGLLELTP